MAITLVNAATTKATAWNSGTPFVVNLPASIVDDDVLIFSITMQVGGLNFPTPAGCTKIGELDHGTSVSVLWRKVASSEGATLTFTTGHGSGLEASAVVTAYRDVDTINPLDVTFVLANHTTVTASQTPTPDPITTVTDGAWVLTIPVGTNSGTSTGFTPPTGYTLDGSRHSNFDPQNAIAHKEITTAGLETPTAWDVGVAMAGGGVYTIALRPASGAIQMTPVVIVPPTGWDYVAYSGAAIPSDSLLYIDDGLHTGADNASVLTDSTQSWTIDELVGMTVKNYSDNSSAIITANTATTITATLAGGTDNDWDTGDNYAVLITVDTGDQIAFEVTTTVGGTVALSNLGVPAITGVAGSHSFDYKVIDITDDSHSAVATFTVNTGAAVSAALTGTIIASVDEADIVAGGKISTITLTNDTLPTAGTNFNAQRQNYIDGYSAASSPTNGWNNEVRDKTPVTACTRISDTVYQIIWPNQAGYDISATETITNTIPASGLVTSVIAVVATPAFTVDFVPLGGAFDPIWVYNYINEVI